MHTLTYVLIESYLRRRRQGRADFSFWMDDVHGPGCVRCDTKRCVSKQQGYAISHSYMLLLILEEDTHSNIEYPRDRIPLCQKRTNLWS